MGKRLWLIRLASVVGALLVGFVLIVAADRLLGWYLRKTGFVKAMLPGKTIIYSVDEHPEVATVSAQGIRNGIIATPKPSNEYRILAIGDSFTFGWGVGDAETWEHKLQERLSIPGKTVSVINAGVPGIGTTTETEVCRAYANQFNADAIILEFYATDDLYQNAGYAIHGDSHPTIWQRLFPSFFLLKNPLILESLPSMPPPFPPVDLTQGWRVMSQSLLKEHPEMLKRLDPEAIQRFLSGDLNADLLGSSLSEPDYLVTMLNPENLDFAVAATAQDLIRFRRTCAGSRPVILVLFPPDELITREYLDYRHKTGYNTDPALLTFDVDTPLSAAAKNAGMSYISLLRSFREDGCPSCYYPWDTHLTPSGTSRAAAFIANQLPRLLPKVRSK